MRILNILLLFIVIELGLPGCGSKDKKSAAQLQQSGSAKQPPLQVEGFIVQSQTLNDVIQVPGSLLAYETTEIHPEVSGRVIQLNVHEGGLAGKGALLAKLYDGDLQAQLRKLEVQLEIAKTTEERSAKLLKIQGISQQDYDLSLLNANNIKADMEIIRTSISKTEIRAPFSGKLGLKNISPGAYITPATVITTISEVNQLKLQFTVPEKYSSRIKNGQDIEFTIEGSSKTYSAKVAATEVFIEEDTRSLSVRAIVRSEDKFLIPGSFAKVKIELGKNEKALMIPSEAIVPQGRKKQIFLFKNGKALTSDILTGARDSANVQVVSGLNQGDTVITTGVLFLRSGIDVILSKINK
jgi:membrane fusion protein (multidrug efflux system)